MMEGEHRSVLCEICQQINFASIFTPREHDGDSGKLKALYRPELGGNGESPGMGWGDQDHGYSIRTGPFKDTLPQTRVADYDQLSDSTQSDNEQHETTLSVPYKPVPVHVNIATELDSIQDPRDDDYVEHAEHDDSNSEENESDEDEKADSVSTWSGDSHFTENTRIDPAKEAQGNWGYQHGELYYLGTIWDLRKRRYECELCFIFWRNLRKKTHVKTHHISKSRCILKLMELKGKKTGSLGGDVSVLNMMFIAGYKLGDPKGWGWNVHMGLLLQGAQRDTSNLVQTSSDDLQEPFNDELFGQARLRYPVCDYALMKKWLHTCEATHSHDSPSPEGNQLIRLIDVEKLCLIELRGRASENQRFCALSYVWGELPQKVVLTIENLERALKPGYFDQPLNQTIQDSFDLVSGLDERYLWIDALCILQDSPEDKSIQLPQMHYIYGRAVLTIVAAHGGNSDAGLPGVQLDSRKGSRFRLELDNVRVSFRTSVKLYAPHDDIGFKPNYLENSIYQSRSWTFQEGYLSTRLLVFTREQIYFECAKCTWMEETHWESNTVDFVGWKAFKDTVPSDDWRNNFERKAHDIDKGFGDGEMDQTNTFAALTKEYSYRRLTHESDILNAYMGVLSAIGKQEETDFFFGLREKHFGNDILFNPTQALERRFPTISPIDFKFPTWSWTAWRGHINIANDAKHSSYDLVRNLAPCDGVRCHKLSIASGIKSIKVINKNGGWRFVKGYIRKGEGIYDLQALHRSPKYERHDNESEQTLEDDSESEASDVDAALRIIRSVSTQKFGAKNIVKQSKSPAKIPEYDQNIVLSDLESHPAYSRIVPDFHIIFRTFSSIVVVRSEYDEFFHLVSTMQIGGTHKLREDSIMSSPSPYQRNIYTCRKKVVNQASSSSSRTSTHQQRALETGNVSSADHPDTCPCCGEADIFPALPDNLELGPYLGRLPQFGTSWDAREYLADIPDGIYLLLWMNNNQLPMFGHILCKPVSPYVSDVSMWRGEILQRVCGAVGPIGILREEQQKKYSAEWGTFILS